MRFYLTLAFLAFSALGVKAQDFRGLIQQGMALSQAKDYAGAVEKFRSALAVEPDNITANYQMAFALNAAGKGTEALPYLQKVVQANPPAQVSGSAYSLMAGLYDVAGQSQKAVQSYQQGIKADSSNVLLRYGLGVAYFRNHQYAGAEQSAVSALQLDPKHALSWRLYALATFHQNKRAPALLGFCRYLWLEPNGPQSAEAFGNLQHILKGGDLKPEPGATPYTHTDVNQNELNQSISQAVALVAKRRYLLAADQLTEQLQAVLYALGKLTGKQNNNDDFFKRLAMRFYALAQTPDMPAFAHYIRQSADKSAAVWLGAHPQQLEALKARMETDR